MEECPACCRKFERFSDFPKIFIDSYRKLELPEIIPAGKKKWVSIDSLPENVSKLFENSEQLIVYEGNVYKKSNYKSLYYVSKDLTGIVKTAIELPEIKKALETLENSVGEEISTKDLLNFPAFKGGLKSGDYNDFVLTLKEDKKQEKELRLVTICLRGVQAGISYRISRLRPDLVEIEYKGRIIH